MRLYRYLLIIFVSGSCTSSAASDDYYTSWNTGQYPVAISIKPGFRRMHNPNGRDSVQWYIDFFNKSQDVKVESVTSYSASRNWGSNRYMRRYSYDYGYNRYSGYQVDLGTTTYTAVRNSYNGIAKLQITIDNNELRTDACSQINFQIRPDSPTRAHVFLTNNEETSVVFIAFNRVSWMQYSVVNRKNFSLDGMTPGSTYQLCMALQDCQNSWNCKTFTTFENNSIEASLYELTVNVEGRDSNWIQLSWLPPKIRRPTAPPIGYIILVRTAENCSEKALYFQAPWLSEDEKHHIQKSAEKLRGVKDCSGGVGDAELRLGDLDGYWPDFPGSRRSTWVEGWNTAEVDEQGPVGLFATTIDNLQPNTNYKLEIWPVFYPSANGATNMPTTLKVSTAKEDSEVVIEPKEMGVSIYHHSNYSYTISEIGAHPIHCQQVQPINTNGAAERLCTRSQQNLSNETHVPLTPGTLYRVKVNSVTKVFQVPAPKCKIMHLNNAAPNPLAFIIRICKSSDDEDCRKYPLYREVVGTYSLYENRSIGKPSPNDDSFNLNVRIRATENSVLHVLLFAYDGNKEKVIHRNAAKALEKNCKNWCVWPAGDWTNTKGKAFGDFNSMFARISAAGTQCAYSCYPLREAIDGEVGCIDRNGAMNLCNIPVCSDVEFNHGTAETDQEALLLAQMEAQIDCVRDVEFNSGTTWVVANWLSPRKSTYVSLHYLILVTSNADGGQCRVSIEKSQVRNLPPFIQTAVRSCNEVKVSGYVDHSSANITGLAQNNTYNVFFVPYLIDGRIGAVLEKVTMTKLARPCQVEGFEINQFSGLSVVKWKTLIKNDCGRPTSITVYINDDKFTIILPNMTQNVSIVHNFEFCENHTWKFDFDNSAGRTTYPFELRTHIEYPEINRSFPTIYYKSGSRSLGVFYTSEHHFCQYEYVLRWGIWPDMKNCEVKSAHHNSIDFPSLEEGLVYNFAARVQPLGASSKCEANKLASNWSETLVYPTEMSNSEVKIRNKRVTSYISKIEDESGERFGCFFPQTENNERYEFRFAQRSVFSDAEKNSVCTIIDWIVEPRSAEFILGYIFQITQPGNASCQVFWIPCEDCFPRNNLTNALPEVTKSITQIESSCLGIQSDLLKNAELLNSKVFKTTTRILIAFQTSVSQRGIFPGVVRVYAVKMGSISRIIEQIWSTNSEVAISKNGMDRGIAAAVAALLSIVAFTVLFIIKSKYKVVRRDHSMKEISQYEMASEVDSVKKIQSDFVASGHLQATNSLNAISNPIYATLSCTQNANNNDHEKCMESYERLHASQSELRDERSREPSTTSNEDEHAILVEPPAS
ncbi:hypothetical protein Aperf_G00000112595 [Anoplocephala perfoliata]